MDCIKVVGYDACYRDPNSETDLNKSEDDPEKQTPVDVRFVNIEFNKNLGKCPVFNLTIYDEPDFK